MQTKILKETEKELASNEKISVILPKSPNLKIFITGDPAAGKSTTAKVLHDTLGIPSFHTDIYMLKNSYTYNSYADFKNKINEILDSHNSYVIDGCSFGEDTQLFNKIANDADVILDFDFPPHKALSYWLKRMEDIQSGEIKHLGMNMGEDYGTPKQFKFFLEYYAKFIEEKTKRKDILVGLSHKVITLNDYTDVDKIIVDLTSHLCF